MKRTFRHINQVLSYGIEETAWLLVMIPTLIDFSAALAELATILIESLVTSSVLIYQPMWGIVLPRNNSGPKFCKILYCILYRCTVSDTFIDKRFRRNDGFFGILHWMKIKTWVFFAHRVSLEILHRIIYGYNACPTRGCIVIGCLEGHFWHVRCLVTAVFHFVKFVRQIWSMPIVFKNWAKSELIAKSW